MTNEQKLRFKLHAIAAAAGLLIMLLGVITPCDQVKLPLGLLTAYGFGLLLGALLTMAHTRNVREARPTRLRQR